MDKSTGASWAGFWLARWALRTWPRFPKICAGFFLQFSLKFLFEKFLFGRSLAQRILAALSLYPFGVKEDQKRRFLSDVPFGQFCLAMYPSADFAASGASWAFWVVWGWIERTKERTGKKQTSTQTSNQRKNERTNRQTNNQASKQTHKPIINKTTNKQANKLTN